MVKKIMLGIALLIGSTTVFASQDVVNNPDSKEGKTDKQKMTISNVNTNKYILGKAADASKNSSSTNPSPSTSLKSSGGIDASDIGLKSAIDGQKTEEKNR